MKKTSLLLVGSLLAIFVYAQDSLKYDYAFLNLDRPSLIAIVEYNNGFVDDLWGKLHFSLKQSRHQIIFRCFEFLNNNGYELTYGELPTGNMTPQGTIEYIFKRKRK